MKKNNKKIDADIYEIGQRIGLSKKNIEDILNYATKNEETFFTVGPPSYIGGMYGTLSIFDF